MNSPKEGGDWSAWSKHVLAELERLNDCVEKNRRDNVRHEVNIAVLQAKAALISAAAGAVSATVVGLVINWLTRGG